MKKKVLLGMTLLGSCIFISCSKSNVLLPEENDQNQLATSIKSNRGVEFDPNGNPKTTSLLDSSVTRSRGTMDPDGSSNRSRGTMDPDGKPIK